ncbi:MAG: hypothetical protein R3B82_14900, partial [Sandaracinaceae bacterium]
MAQPDKLKHFGQHVEIGEQEIVGEVRINDIPQHDAHRRVDQQPPVRAPVLPPQPEKDRAADAQQQRETVKQPGEQEPDRQQPARFRTQGHQDRQQQQQDGQGLPPGHAETVEARTGCCQRHHQPDQRRAHAGLGHDLIQHQQGRRRKHHGRKLCPDAQINQRERREQQVKEQM